MNERVSKPLDGVLVVDLIAGQMAAIGRTLVELGAEVIRVEPEGGSNDRGAAGDIRTAIAFSALNLGKRSMVADLSTEAGRSKFAALLDRADFLIDDASPDAAIHLEIDEIHRNYPALTIMSVSNFGIGNSFSSWHATDPVFHALSSELARSGLEGHRPLLLPGELAAGTSSSQAVYALLIAFINRVKTGKGDRLDFSVLEGTCHALDPSFGIGGSATLGKRDDAVSRSRPPKGIMYPILNCTAGRVRLCVLAPRQWQALFTYLGKPKEFADPKFNDTKVRFASPTLLPAIEAFFADKTRLEIEQAAAELGFPASGVDSLAEALQSQQVKAREMLTNFEVEGGQTAAFVNGTMVVDSERMGPTGPAPALGEFSGTIGGKPIGEKPTADFEGSRPLEGLKVLDLGVIVVGAELGRLLGDQGADVIKVEAKAFPDGSRQTEDPNELISLGFATGHRNKRSLGLNLRDPEGIKLFLKLAEKADVIVSNFKAGTMEGLGLGYDVIKQVNPKIIMSDSSAFGPTGPWASRMGYGPLVRASAGMTDRWKYPDEPDSFSDSVTIYPDHTAARYGGIGVLSLLIRRMRTGLGGVVSTAQAEVMLGHMAAEVAGQSVGLEEEFADAPWGVYPCKGDDEWCVVTARNGEDFQAICDVAGLDGFKHDPALQTRDGRMANVERIEAALCSWLADKAPEEAMRDFQAAGVPSAKMMRVNELPTLPVNVERKFFREEKHPLIPEPFLVANAPTISSHLAEPETGPAPMMGEHTKQVVAEWLGLSNDKIDALVDQEVLEPIKKLVAAE